MFRSNMIICNFVSQTYHDETQLEEKERISHALASIEDEELLKEVLKFASSVSYAVSADEKDVMKQKKSCMHIYLFFL